MEQIRLDSTAAVAECILQKGDNFDEIALQMIRNNQIGQLITPVEYEEDSSLIRYPIQGKTSLYDLIREEEDWRKVRELLLTICRDPHQELKEYLLYHNQIYYDPQYLYIEQGMVQYIYIPEKGSNTYNLKKMLHNVLTNNKWNAGGRHSDFERAVQFLESIQWLTGREKQQFIELLEDIDVQLPRSEAELLTFKEEPSERPSESSLSHSDAEESPSEQPVPDAEDHLAENHETAEPVPEGPYLIRQRTKEKIVITSDYFRIGKIATEVEYVLSGNSAISRQHAVIVKRGSNYYIMDTRSKNRTYVDGRVISPNQPELINHETRVRMADEEFIFYLQ